MSRTTRVAATAGGIAAMGSALLLLFLLTSVTRNASQFDRYFSVLFWANIVSAAVLLIIVVGFSARLALRWRQKRFGSRLLTKISLIFVIIGALPGLVIYTVSYQFVSRSIESWFDVKVESALEAGLNLGRTTIDELLKEFQNKTRNAASVIGESDSVPGPIALDRARERIGAEELVLFTGTGQVLATASGSRVTLVPDLPSQAQLRQLRFSRGIAITEPIGDDASRLRMRVVVPIVAGQLPSLGDLGLSRSTEQRYLQAQQLVPEAVARNALAVQDAYREYQERAAARKGLQRLYIGTLTLTLCLALFAALLMAVLLSNQLARPLLVLAEGVKAVAEGDLSPKKELLGKDELGGLTRDFNSMTRQLAEARALAEERRAQVETSRAYLQSLLDNMSAGVLVLDAADAIELSNPSAERILGQPLPAGLPLASVAQGRMLNALNAGFASYNAEAGHWTRQIELEASTSNLIATDGLTILMRGTLLQLPQSTQRALVFDDITELISAQRSVAWAEVARRVAHEIKNPLTPIQLSAERLQRKLTGQLTQEGQALLEKSVGTIVNQVDAMKRMVNDFRDYARLPPAALQPLDLNELVSDVVHLYASDDSQTSTASKGIKLTLAPDLPLIDGDTTQLRQVIHNLLQNAGDAVAGQADGAVQVRTELGQGFPPRVRLVVSDNGGGFSEAILKRAFEPYVTTKTRGTGLGLAIVKKIMDEHGARIDLRNLEREAHGTPCGAQVSLTFTLKGAAAQKAA